MERGRRDKWRSFSYVGSPKVYDAQVIKADYLIENIDLAFEAWQQRGGDKYCPFDDFCNYLLPYWVTKFLTVAGTFYCRKGCQNVEISR